MDAPNLGAGEQHPHTNTQLFGTVAPESNRFLPYEGMQPPFNAPDDSARQPTMDGFVLDYVNTFRSEMGRLPEYDEYVQIMSVYTPEQLPVISTIAKGFATFDHWFCEVPRTHTRHRPQDRNRATGARVPGRPHQPDLARARQTTILTSTSSWEIC